MMVLSLGIYSLFLKILLTNFSIKDYKSPSRFEWSLSSRRYRRRRSTGSWIFLTRNDEFWARKRNGKSQAWYRHKLQIYRKRNLSFFKNLLYRISPYKVFSIDFSKYRRRMWHKIGDFRGCSNRYRLASSHIIIAEPTRKGKDKSSVAETRLDRNSEKVRWSDDVRTRSRPVWFKKGFLLFSDSIRKEIDLVSFTAKPYWWRDLHLSILFTTDLSYGGADDPEPYCA